MVLIWLSPRSATSTRRPPAGRGRAVTTASCASATALTTASPSPSPPATRVSFAASCGNGSNSRASSSVGTVGPLFSTQDASRRCGSREWIRVYSEPTAPLTCLLRRVSCDQRRRDGEANDHIRKHYDTGRRKPERRRHGATEGDAYDDRANEHRDAQRASQPLPDAYRRVKHEIRMLSGSFARSRGFCRWPRRRQ
jgi:hypothetical protein